MSKVIEKRNFILLFIVLSMVCVPFLAEAGGMGGKSSGMSTKHNTTSYVYTNNSRLGSLGAYYPSTYKSLYNSAYSPYRYTSAYPYTTSYARPYGTTQAYGLGTWPYNNYGYGQTVVTGKDYNVEESFTRYVPGGEVTTTVGETTETSTVGG